MRLIRVWAVTAVTPLARVHRSRPQRRRRISSSDYFVLLDVREENKRLQDRTRPHPDGEPVFCAPSSIRRTAPASLAIFQSQSPSKTIAAHIIGNTTGAGAKVVIVDRGTTSGIQKGMAVITPDGIVGKVVSAYPTASFVLLITDPTFAAGVHLAEEPRARNTKGARATAP